MNFDSKVALVTGGANGIGRATARLFSERGAAVAVVDRDEEGGAETARLIEAGGGRALFVPGDVTRSGEVRRFVEATLDAFGGIDCFFNNAGIEGRLAPIHKADEDAFDSVIGVNLKGAFLGLRHVLPVMVRQGRGAVVNTASTGGLFGAPGLAAYVASKHGVLGLTKVAALDMAPHGIRVNAVCPGPIETRMIRAIESQREALGYGSAPSVKAGYGVPEDVAGLVLFLCSDLAGNITGASMTCDGGRSAQTSGVALARGR